ncbi:hypothetical protein [Geomonas azotofigens]|uniref:hypothetical protein n=1 Tax=Geomonas azotofigens TaxID=2843196 RepID=UPI001C115AA3|nr:hypothetical protein [Geomonas azotofigens]MBU5614685.1 hypothetical protein [Geomonas azotofigens]
MGWQEEEIAKLRNTEEATSTGNKNKEKVAITFWKSVLDANQSLLPELRLSENEITGPYVVQHRLLNRYGYGITLFVWIINDAITYTLTACNGHGKLEIFLDQLNNIVATREESSGDIFLENKLFYYVVNSYTPEILLKNIIQNKFPPHTGLEQFDYDPKKQVKKNRFWLK